MPNPWWQWFHHCFVEMQHHVSLHLCVPAIIKLDLKLVSIWLLKGKYRFYFTSRFTLWIISISVAYSLGSIHFIWTYTYNTMESLRYIIKNRYPFADVNESVFWDSAIFRMCPIKHQIDSHIFDQNTYIFIHR